MNCIFEQIGEGEFQCVNCGYTKKSKYPAHMIHRSCNAPSTATLPRPKKRNVNRKPCSKCPKRHL